MQPMRMVLLAGTVAGLFVAAQAQTPSSPDDIIAARQAGYKHIGEIFYVAMKKGIQDGKDVQQFAIGAKEIADWSRKIPTMFPPGTETGHNTHATAAVGSDRQTFIKNAGILTIEAEKLAQVAATGDKAAFAAQWATTGDACGNCHTNQKFRTRL